jgi:hypothetical protein
MINHPCRGRQHLPAFVTLLKATGGVQIDHLIEELQRRVDGRA